MMFQNKNLFKIVLALLLVPISIYAAMAGSAYFFHRAELAKWTPEKARAEAKKDIEAGSMKIYLHGSFAAFPVGVKEEQESFIVNLPTAEAGVGCVIEYMDVFEAQGRYAIHYNKAIVQYLQTQARTAAKQG